MTSGYELETAGVLKGGKKFWALARTGQSSALKGNDVVQGYFCCSQLPVTVRWPPQQHQPRYGWSATTR